jgi:WD40 repeat protein
VNCVRFNEESTVVMSGSVDTLVKIWDCRSRSQEPIQQLEDSKVPILAQGCGSMYYFWTLDPHY